MQYEHDGIVTFEQFIGGNKFAKGWSCSESFEQINVATQFHFFIHNFFVDTRPASFGETCSPENAKQSYLLRKMTHCLKILLTLEEIPCLVKKGPYLILKNQLYYYSLKLQHSYWLFLVMRPFSTHHKAQIPAQHKLHFKYFYRIGLMGTICTM